MNNARNTVFGRKYRDPDVQAFLNATGITDTAIIASLEYLVTELKINFLWTKVKALYPVVGGTAFTHKFNLKNPLNTNAAFRLSFIGTWVHSATGMKPDGITASAFTFFVPSVEFTATSGHIYFYSRTNSAGGYDVGASDDGGAVVNTTSLIIRYSGDVAYGNYGNGSYAVSLTSTDSRGGFGVNRNDNINTTLWKNGTKIKTTAEAVTLTSQPLSISSIRTGGGIGFHSNKECALLAFTDGLSDAEKLIHDNIIQVFETMNSRQV